MEYILSPSLLSSDFGRLAEELAALEEAGLKWVHWDVMDGLFVPNITFGPPVIGALRTKSKLFFDVHLMIERPERYISHFVDAGADLLCFHAEASTHLERTVSAVTEAGVKVGLALNPHTPLSLIRYLLPQLDMVLVMSVNPGFGGQSFIPFTRDKIRELAEMAREAKPDLLIQVDGGVTPDNVADLARLGANVFVSGSAFFGFPPYGARLETFMQALSQA